MRNDSALTRAYVALEQMRFGDRLHVDFAIAGGVFELELQGGTRLRTGRQYSDGIRTLIRTGN